MNPELEQLQRRVEALEQAQNLNAVKSLLDVLIKNTPNVSNSDVTLTITESVSGGAGGSVTVNVLDFPDKWVELYYNGEIYRIPAYLKRLDPSR